MYSHQISITPNRHSSLSRPILEISRVPLDRERVHDFIGDILSSFEVEHSDFFTSFVRASKKYFSRSILVSKRGDYPYDPGAFWRSSANDWILPRTFRFLGSFRNRQFLGRYRHSREKTSKPSLSTNFHSPFRLILFLSRVLDCIVIASPNIHFQLWLSNFVRDSGDLSEPRQTRGVIVLGSTHQFRLGRESEGMISRMNQNPIRNEGYILREMLKKEDVKRFFCNYFAFMVSLPR